jgi:hypothetical protein
MLDWLLEEGWIWAGAILLLGLIVAAIVIHDQAERRYEQELLARAHTFQDTLVIQQIMAQRRTADAIVFGAGVIAGSQASRR